ncbi:MAG: terminase small subunit [Desulfobacteraceae bacterium]|nr:terminase small subunit [Desulfobacteraceae bacterium]
MKKDPLTKLQRAFVDEYLKSPNMNATECIRRAGYKTKYPDKMASQLLGNTRVLSEIEKDRIKREERTNITKDMVLKELSLLMNSDLRNYIDIDPNTGAIRAKGFDEMPEGASRALKSIREDRVIKEDADGKKVTVYDKVKFDLYDKVRVIELVAKHLGMLVERHEVTGEDGGPVKIEYVLIKAKKQKKDGDGKGKEE